MVYQEYSGLARQGVAPSLSYLFDPTSGVYRPLKPSDLSAGGGGGGGTTVVNGGYIGITGSVNTSFQNTILAISGLTSLQNPILAVSGNSNSTIQNSILAVSGLVSLQNTLLAVSGNSNATIQNSILPVSGVLTIGNTSVSTTLPRAAAASNFSISGTNGTCLLANANRKSFLVQNLSSGTTLYVKLGASASDNSFNLVLKKGDATDDGLGGSVSDTTWTGVVSVSGAASTVRYIASEII